MLPRAEDEEPAAADVRAVLLLPWSDGLTGSEVAAGTAGAETTEGSAADGGALFGSEAAASAAQTRRHVERSRRSILDALSAAGGYQFKTDRSWAVVLFFYSCSKKLL